MAFQDGARLLQNWNTGSDGTDETYVPGDGITKNITLHARFMDHDWTSVTALDPTCTEDGYDAYECGSCGAGYTEPVDVLGHLWDPEADDTQTEWGEDSSGNVTCTVTLTCRRTAYDPDPETLTIPCEVTAEITDASCTEDGEIVYTAVGSAQDDNGEDVTVEVSKTKVIPATGHTVVTDDAVSPTCTKTGLTEGSHCAVCNDHTYTDVLEDTGRMPGDVNGDGTVNITDVQDLLQYVNKQDVVIL